MKIVICDMDDVTANFCKGAGLAPSNDKSFDPPCMYEPGFYRNLELVAGAKEAIDLISEMKHIDLYIASKPLTKTTYSASEKYDWIKEHFPYLIRKMFLTCDKTLLRADFMIDDDVKWRDGFTNDDGIWRPGFQGEFLHFDPENPIDSWKDIIKTLSCCESKEGQKNSQVAPA